MSVSHTGLLAEPGISALLPQLCKALFSEGNFGLHANSSQLCHHLMLAYLAGKHLGSYCASIFRLESCSV